MATTQVSLYKIYCVTEGVYVNVWLPSAPTTCPNNNSHTVNTNSVQLLQTISSNAVSIVEDKISILRNVRVKDIAMTDVAPNTSKSMDYVFNFVTSMYSFSFSSDDTNTGDQYSISIYPDTNLGYITADVEEDDTVISVPSIFMLYASTGFNAYLYTGAINEDLGQITSMDRVNNTITVENPASQAFSSASTFIRMTYFVANKIVLGAPGTMRFGDDVIGGATIPVGTLTRYTYYNNALGSDLTDKPKSLVMYFTILM